MRVKFLSGVRLRSRRVFLPVCGRPVAPVPFAGGAASPAVTGFAPLSKASCHICVGLSGGPRLGPSGVCPSPRQPHPASVAAAPKSWNRVDSLLPLYSFFPIALAILVFLLPYEFWNDLVSARRKRGRGVRERTFSLRTQDVCVCAASLYFFRRHLAVFRIQVLCTFCQIFIRLSFIFACA